MNQALVADSSCDLSKELQESFNATLVPFSMTLGEQVFVDDDELDLASFMQALDKNTARVGSAAPSPLLFKEAFERAKARYAVTLSSKLSACYENAVLGAKMLNASAEETPHVFDSLSASAGEVLVAVKINQLLREGIKHAELVKRIEAFIAKMKTYFVLENIDNLLKNGRLNKVTGKLTTLLNIRPILGSDGQGHIKLFGYGRSQKSIVAKMAATVAESKRETETETLVITHCNNHALANRIVEAIAATHTFKEVLVLPTKGLSSVYADNEGVIMSF